MESEALLSDGPIAAPDPEMINEVLAVRQRPVRDGMTMIVGTQNMIVGTQETGFARGAADRVAFPTDGRIERRTPEKCFTQPRGERAKGVLSEILKH